MLRCELVLNLRELCRWRIGGWIRMVTGENRKIGGTLLWSGYFVITIDQASPHLACTGVGLLYDVKQRQIKIHFFRIICYRIEVLELFNSFLNLLCYFSTYQYPTHACAFPNFDCDVLTFFAFLLPSFLGSGDHAQAGAGGQQSGRDGDVRSGICAASNIFTT